MVQRSPLALAILDGDTQAVRYANAAFRDVGGLLAPILVGRTADTTQGSAASRVIELIRQVSETGEPEHDVEIVFAASDKDPCVLALTIWPLGPRRGAASVVMLCVRDISDDVVERRRLQELTEQLRDINERLVLTSLREADFKDQAQAASESKSAFLATMSHELRTPLSAIIGYQDLLISGITGPINAAQATQLERIKKSASHLLALIEQVLTFSRLEANREAIGREPVDAAEICEVVSAIIAPLAAEKGLAFVVAPPPAPVTLDTDPLKVRQILVNLLGNAVKFTQRGQITLSVRGESNAVVFDVSDTGIGIAPAHIDRVFDAFWQVQQTPARLVGGSGLGLSVARRLARLLGGDLTAGSVLGVGSTFSLRLPVDNYVLAGL